MAVIEAKVIDMITDGDNESKEHKMEDMKVKMENLFSTAREFISNAVTKEDIVAAIKLVAVGSKRLIQLSWKLGVAMGTVLVEYIQKFIAWIATNVNKAMARFAKSELEAAAK